MANRGKMMWVVKENRTKKKKKRMQHYKITETKKTRQCHCTEP